MEVKILGTGCPKCKRLEQLAREAAEEAGIQATFTKVTDMEAIMAYPILGTPGLVVNEGLSRPGASPVSLNPSVADDPDMAAWAGEVSGG